MIATLAEIKTLLGISVSTHDARIQALIPLVEEDVCDHCRDDFLSVKYGSLAIIESGTLVFNNSANTITCNDTTDFAINDDIRIYNTVRNDGPYRISNVSSNVLTIDSVYSLVDETVSAFLIKVEYPKALKRVFANMINYNIKDKFDKAVKTEKIDDYSYTLSDNVEGYPNSIVNNLNGYRKPFKQNYANYCNWPCNAY
jgi:hypothetical protein